MMPRLQPVQRGESLQIQQSKVHQSVTDGAFAQVLEKAQAGLKFSAHAQSRLTSRNIDMTPEMMGKLDRAVEGAAKKGAKDSLILLSDLAFIVNIPNRTVVTAMDGKSMKDNIVTNIDSTVIAD
jgi:flagellar operon protein